jgi:hypothetical protein
MTDTRPSPVAPARDRRPTAEPPGPSPDRALLIEMFLADIAEFAARATPTRTPTLREPAPRT